MEKKFLAVAYLHNGETYISAPFDTREEAERFIKEKLRESPKSFNRTKATTIISRDMSNVKDGFLFGHPKSLDVMQDKKFLKTL